MLTNHYWYVPEALTQQQCDDIQHAAAATEQIEGIHFGHDENHRDSQVSWLYDPHITDLIAALVRQANTEAGWRYDLQATEAVQYTRYHPQGRYRWHIDGNQDHHAARKFTTQTEHPNPLTFTPFPKLQGLVRKLSATVNLTNPEDYEGGELQIRCYDQLHTFNNAPRGSMTVFPSFMDHQITPITKGQRHSAVMWYNGYPLR